MHEGDGCQSPHTTFPPPGWAGHPLGSTKSPLAQTNSSRSWGSTKVPVTPPTSSKGCSTLIVKLIVLLEHLIKAGKYQLFLGCPGQHVSHFWQAPSKGPRASPAGGRTWIDVSISGMPSSATRAGRCHQVRGNCTPRFPQMLAMLEKHLNYLQEF